MSARKLGARLGAVLTAALLLGGCAADPRVRAKSLEDENKQLARSVQAADQAVQGTASYLAEMQSPAKAGGAFSLYFTPETLERMATQAVPYRMQGREFNSKLKGEIIVERVTDFQFLSRNRLRCKAHLRGEKIKYTGSVPSFAKGQVKDFEQAVTKGAIADLEVRLELDGPHVIARAQATDIRLKAKRDSSAESRLQDEMNKKALRLPLVFDMTIQGQGAVPRRLLVTGNHVVVTYAP
ncbi:hypothetical protein HPC49_36700 [Pyxidicoccus fallax]|uniref:Lipoprotein n=1 Tax=Pyxidicoccus fallax TaxID=394095 RepID=A0A848LTE6_9BACT|nr:hypothetical protein [Pyxidicoccus fallax]NMO20882.1 hypothetical protein [Pyxidicoccus fallax]NPC83746.1 hypothetical protein [Pyxidicoccus fallax]